MPRQKCPVELPCRTGTVQRDTPSSLHAQQHVLLPGVDLEAEPCPGQTVVESTVTVEFSGSERAMLIFTAWVTSRTRRNVADLERPQDRWSARCTSGKKGK